MENKESVPPNFAPPPPGFSTSATQQTLHVIAYGSEPQHMKCPYCETNITTRVTKKTSTKTHVIAILLCIFGCWPCAPCPYCIDSCLVPNHYCPQCNNFLGQGN